MLIATTPPAPTPAPTPPPALASALGFIQPRQFDYSYDSGCYNYANALQCTNVLSGCYSDFTGTDYNAAATACYCTYGMSYLDCFYSQIATGTCASYWFGSAGYADYQMSYYSEYCGSIPPDAMAQMQAPATVDLEFDTVDVVTATGALQQPNYGVQPSYQGSGNLLQGDCAQTDFTLVNAGSTVYYAGFQGCNNDRPECCPFAVATPASLLSGSAATAAAGANDGDSVDFPVPVNDDFAVMKSCADDYYSISGGCCPTGFWPFTMAVGGATPCWSSVGSIAAPTLTLPQDAQTLDKPTSAVVNIVWSMRYPVADPGGSGGLSTAAKAGIGAGAGVAAILIAGLAICLWRVRRKNKKLAEAQQPAQPAQPQMQQQQQQQQQQPPFQQQQTMQPPNGQYPPGAFHPGMGAGAGAMAAPTLSDRTSILTSATPVSANALVPQHTGTSNGAVSELSSPSGQNLLHNAGQPAGYFAGGAAAAAAAANPRVSYGSSSNGTGSPAVGGANGGGGQGYPAPIAEADEGQHHHQQQHQQQQYAPQYGYQQHPQQQHPQQQYYAQGQAQGQYYPPQNGAHEVGGRAQGQGQGQGQGQYAYPPHPPQGGYAYPPHQHQHQQHQQQGYPQNVPEMSAHREADPPQEVMGSQPVPSHHVG